MDLSCWGRYPRVETTPLAFESEESLREILVRHRDLIPHGNGRSYGDSALSRRIVPMRPHDTILEFDKENGLLHVQAGVLLAEILETIVPRGWFFRVTPGTRLITVGGAIASDVHGKNHHVAGCFSDWVKDFRIMLADGRVVTCSKSAAPELFKATCGGQGLTGIILSARIFLQRILSTSLDQTTIKTRNLEETFDAFEQYRDAPYSVAWIDCQTRGKAMGRSLLMLGDFRKDGNLRYRNPPRRNLPFDLPGPLLNRWTVKAFNNLYFARAGERVSRRRVDIDTFFYPLDAIGHWNRLYGRKGFLQYQFILPRAHSYDGLAHIMRAIATSGKGSFLAVLKLYGPANQNWLSFPMEGYSLALDFKIDRDIFSLLNKLDSLVVRYGGRIYLAKDARVSREIFETGYPDIDTFRTFRKDNGLEQVFQSLQSQRVGI